MSEIILFGRYPTPGRTKTRLIPLLGPLGAADFQREMTERTLNTLTGAQAGRVTFCYSGAQKQKVKRWLSSFPIRLKAQSDGDLGHRMASAIHEALSRAKGPVLLTGSDIPELTTAHVNEAIDALTDCDLVLGPSRDGGYWLVGCKELPDIFRDIPWGTSAVLEKTLAAAGRQDLAVKLLAPLNDMDTPKDLQRWQPKQNWRKPFLSIVIPTLNEAKNIDHIIGRLISTDIEVICVDGGSTDKTAALARQAGAEVIVTGPDRAEQQNRGAAASSGRVLLFLHADTHLPGDFSRYIFECLLDKRVATGAFRFKTDMNHWGMRIIEVCAHLRSKVLRIPYGDQALFMKKEVFEKAGGFPSVAIAEDLMLVRRLAGFGRIRIVPAAAVTSARRWRRMGIVRTTVINYLVAIGCLLKIPPKHLAPLYRGKAATRDIKASQKKK